MRSQLLVQVARPLGLYQSVHDTCIAAKQHVNLSFHIYNINGFYLLAANSSLLHRKCRIYRKNGTVVLYA